MSDERKITAAEVKQLRDATGAGVMDAKRALGEANGDFDGARDLLRQWGLAGVEKRAARQAADGMVAHYLHQVNPELPAKLAVLVELNCETDFVAKTPEFKELGRDIAMHVAAEEPRWVSREEVPQEFIDKEKSVLLGSETVKGKPENVVERIIEGQLNSLLTGRGGELLEQKFLKDESGKKTVADVIGDLAASVKENIVVRRFVRLKVGEE